MSQCGIILPSTDGGDHYQKGGIINTTKEQHIALIRSWQPEDESFDDNDHDIWEIYRDYIEGKKEISECNAAAARSMDYAVIE